MEAYVHGVSTRKVDDLVKALGAASGISKSEVSRICAELDRDLSTFRDRPLDHVAFRYVFLDATYIKGRVHGHVVSRAVVIATGVTATGDREVLGIDVGDSEDGAFWTAFLKGLRARGLAGVKLVISDHHLGLKAAIAAVFIGSSWQRCRVHFMRNVLSKSRKHPARWSPPRSARSSRNPTPSTSGPSSTRSLTCSPPSSPTSRRCSPTLRGPPRVHRVPARALAQDLVDQPARADQRRNQTAHQRRRASSPTTPRSSDSSPPSSSKPTTSGPSANAATSPKNPWPRSTTPSSQSRRCLSPSRRDTLTTTSTITKAPTYTTPRDAIADR